MEKLKIEYLPLERLKPYAKNAKIHTEEQVAQIEKSINEFGFNDPIAVWGDDTVIEGHGRLMAAQAMGLKEVPVIRLDGLTDEQRRAYTLVHNKLTLNSGFDVDLLSLELDDIFDLDMSEFGFNFLDEDDKRTEITEDEAPEPPEEPQTKIGDLWQLGEHRLICGDISSKAVVDALTGGGIAHLLLTDPPYGINADKGFSGARGFNGKGNPIECRHYQDDWDSKRPDKCTFEMICKTAENAIVFGGNFFTDQLPVGNHWLVWNKHNTMPTYSDAELAWTNIKRNSVKLYDFLWNGLIGKEKERFHPTQKPVGLFAAIIEDYTREGETVYDFYGGSGTTMIACEQLHRKCYMAELSPKYCDAIIGRWENFTGKKAVLLNAEQGRTPTGTNKSN